MKTFQGTVPATLSNLGPGFDCFGLSVNLGNRIRAWQAETERLRFVGPHADGLEVGPNNLLLRSLKRCVQTFGLHVPPLDIEVEVLVPPGRGLGSSATAVAAGLALAAHFGGREIAAADLCALGRDLEGHPDNVVPALVGGLCLCLPEAGRHLRFELPPGLRFVAVSPVRQVSTEEARKALPQSVPLQDAVFNLGRAAVLAAALVSGQWEAIQELDLVLDRLHQPTRSRNIPGFEEIVEAGCRAGALGVCISGSGPTVLGLVAGTTEPVAEAMGRILSQQGIEYETRILEPNMAGILHGFTEIESNFNV